MVVEMKGPPGGSYQVQQGDRPRGPGGYPGGSSGYQGGSSGYQGRQSYQGGSSGYQGGQSGDRQRGDRGPSSGGQMDPDRLFMMLAAASGGRDTIRFDNLPPETKAVMRQMSERMGVPPMPESGEWTRNQFMDYYQRNQAVMQSRQGSSSSGGSNEDRGMQRLREQDRNGDGRVSRDEADRMLQPNFDRIDADHDGYITLDEYRGYYASRDNGGNSNSNNYSNSRDPRNDPGRPGDPYGGNFYDKGDGRSDGREQKKEPEVAIRYGKLPKDAPGYFTEYDLNKDGQLELSEWRLSSGDIRDFIKYDMDGDGILTFGEYNRYKEQQATLAKTKAIDPETGEEIEGDPSAAPSPRYNPMAGGSNGPRPGGNSGSRPDPKSGGSGRDSGGSNPFRNNGRK